MATREALAAYHRKRNFSNTPEPHQAGKHSTGGLSFVIQKHHASQLHYDFRLELNGTLKSWAVPKGPCLDPGVKRMAVHVEDHPLSYADFEGSIPEGNYGAGDVIVWDRGEWLPDEDAHKGYASGKLKFELKGQKLHGHWALVRMRGKGEKQEPWLLIKDTDSAARPLDEYDVLAQEPASVISGRDVAQHAQPPAKPPAKKTAAKKAATKKAPSVKRASASKPARLPRITHAERVIDKSSGTTKGDLVAYYQGVANLILTHLHQRPVSLVRAPEGVGGELFFQKHAQGRELPHVTLLDPSLDPEHAPLLQIDSTAALLSAAQMNTIELHTWNATSKVIDKPDRMTFDLDPGEGVPWDRMQDAALLVQTLLVELGMTPFLKTSGGKGLHVVVPVRRHFGWDDVKDFSRAVVAHLAETIPERFVVKSGPKNRVGKIFVDYLRNGFGATTACAWSVRARPGLGVSVPVAWDELASLESGAHWTLSNIESRLAIGNTPWADFEKRRVGLAAPMRKLGFTPAR